MSEDEDQGFSLPIINPDDNVETTEPKLTMLDDASRELLYETIFSYKYIEERATGRIIKVRDKVIYPELKMALSYAASHLNSVMNYTWTQGRAELLYWEGLYYDPLSLYYFDNPDALRCLDTLNMNLRRAINGGSVQGSHQRYNVQMAGAHRTYEMRRGNGQ